MRYAVSRIWIVCFVAGCFAANSARAETLNEQFLKLAPEIITNLQEKGYKNVGVLKFRIKKGEEDVSDDVGTLNQLAADRLETALILANPHDEAEQLGIIRDASAVAAGISGANHLNPEGRKRLFSGEYPLAWGDRQVKPDVLLSGVMVVPDDLQQMTVGIFYFDASGGKLQKIVPVFKAEPEPLNVTELGESFNLRGAFDGGTTQLTGDEAQEKKKKKVVQQASLVKKGESKFPLEDPVAPVKLRILYDGQPVSLQIKDGAAFIPEPEEHQEVQFVLERNDPSNRRYGVVLKVNGESTLYRHTKPALSCAKWIIEAQSKPITIRGYQMDAETAEKFLILSREESRAHEMHYGKDVGQISITVFQETPDDLPPGDFLDEEAEDLLALTRSAFPKKKANSLSALKFALRGGIVRARGLIVAGQETAQQIRKVKLDPDPTPVMSATVTYYKP